MKKVVAILLAVLMVLSLAACGPKDDGKMLIEVVAKGEQHQFWQQVRKGSIEAGEALGVSIKYVGPASESDIQVQVEMVDAALARNPDALCLAALDTKSVTNQLIACKEKNIPVIGFDSGIANPPEGVVKSTASTNNYEAGALGAEHMAKEIDAKLVKGARIVVVSQDVTSVSVGERSAGFIDKMYDLLTAKGLSVSIEGATQSKGSPAVAQKRDYPATKAGADVVIEFRVPANVSEISLVQGEAAAALAKAGVVGAFGSNEWGIRGIIEAANADSKIRDLLTSKAIYTVGFDSGTALLGALRDKLVHGAVTQNPYAIGYQAVSLAVKAAKGEKIDTIVDTGCQWYTTDTWYDADIVGNLYDWPDDIKPKA